MRDGGHDTATLRAIARLRRHRYGAFVEPLVDEPSFLAKSMFGGIACYLHGRMMLVLMDRRPPWRGLLIVLDRDAHASLRTEVSALVVHPTITKWLYLPDTASDFEEGAADVVALVLRDDPRLGVESKPRAPRRTATTAPRRPAPARKATPRKSLAPKAARRQALTRKPGR